MGRMAGLSAARSAGFRFGGRGGKGRRAARRRLVGQVVELGGQLLNLHFQGRYLAFQGRDVYVALAATRAVRSLHAATLLSKAACSCASLRKSGERLLNRDTVREHRRSSEWLA